MKHYVLSRLIQFPLILVAIYLITFVCVWLAPGDPFAGEKNIDPAILQMRKEQLHASTWYQFLGHYPVAALRGDLGKSMNNLAWDVRDLIAGRLGVSVSLGLLAILFAVIGGMTVGTLSAVRRNGLLDWVGVSMTLVGISFPSFVVAAGLMILFVAKLGWFPMGGGEGGPTLMLVVLRLATLVAAVSAACSAVGRGSRFVTVLAGATLCALAFYVGDVRASYPLLLIGLSACAALAVLGGTALRIAAATLAVIALALLVRTGGQFAVAATALRELFLPALALSLVPMATIVRLQRVSMLDVIGADHVRTARAKGLSKPRVVVKHCLRNAFLPVFTYLGPAAAFALTGSFVVESIFSVKGLGEQFVQSVLNRDATMLLAQTMIYSLLLLALNLVVDLGYAFVDPRIDVTAGKA